MKQNYAMPLILLLIDGTLSYLGGSLGIGLMQKEYAKQPGPL
ncbi:hypothetical protein [Agrobacterium vitis]|nr:hypothetical protein [Agrobacterium vitis]